MLFCCMMTFKEVFTAFHTGLQGVYDGNEIEALALNVLKHITGKGRAAIKAFADTTLSADQEDEIDHILSELKTGKPLQYILGEAHFYGLTFNVNASVLIPRPETEELVDWVLNSVKGVAALKILDIGTGSGCIAISLKYNFPAAQVSAVDVSASALATATSNAELNNVLVNFIKADILSVSPDDVPGLFDVIVSNPPYVTSTDKLQMHNNVTDFEPHTALFVPDEEPLLFYKAIADFALEKLVSGGFLFFEINESYGPQTVAMLHDKGFKNIELRKDMSGRDRMIKCCR